MCCAAVRVHLCMCAPCAVTRLSRRRGPAALRLLSGHKRSPPGTSPFKPAHPCHPSSSSRQEFFEPALRDDVHVVKLAAEAKGVDVEHFKAKTGGRGAGAGLLGAITRMLGQRSCNWRPAHQAGYLCPFQGPAAHRLPAM